MILSLVYHNLIDLAGLMNIFGMLTNSEGIISSLDVLSSDQFGGNFAKQK